LATTFLTAAQQANTKNRTQKFATPSQNPLFETKPKKNPCLWHICQTLTLCKKAQKSGAEGICVGVANMTPLSAYKLQKAKSQAGAQN